MKKSPTREKEGRTVQTRGSLPEPNGLFPGNLTIPSSPVKADLQVQENKKDNRLTAVPEVAMAFRMAPEVGVPFVRIVVLGGFARIKHVFFFYSFCRPNADSAGKTRSSQYLDFSLGSGRLPTG